MSHLFKPKPNTKSLSIKESPISDFEKSIKIKHNEIVSSGKLNETLLFLLSNLRSDKSVIKSLYDDNYFDTVLTRKIFFDRLNDISELELIIYNEIGGNIAKHRLLIALLVYFALNDPRIKPLFSNETEIKEFIKKMTTQLVTISNIKTEIKDIYKIIIRSNDSIVSSAVSLYEEFLNIYKKDKIFIDNFNATYRNTTSLHNKLIRIIALLVHITEYKYKIFATENEKLQFIGELQRELVTISPTEAEFDEEMNINIENLQKKLNEEYDNLSKKIMKLTGISEISIIESLFEKTQKINNFKTILELLTKPEKPIVGNLIDLSGGNYKSKRLLKKK